MASTVTPSTFQVRIKEDHVINGVRTVNENLYRVHNVTNYDRRIVTVPVNTNQGENQEIYLKVIGQWNAYPPHQ